jgi:hypothetical protein
MPLALAGGVPSGFGGPSCRRGESPRDGIATALSGLYASLMTREMIVQIWESEGSKLSGNTLAIREEREATCFIETKGELMGISRVTKLELSDGFVSIGTAKDERYVFAYGDILGFKLSSPTTPNKDRPAGFGR